MSSAADFDAFWSTYPSRVGSQPKFQARISWDKALTGSKGKYKSAPTDPVTILAGLRAYAADPATKAQVGTSFIPMAATWLNQRRWEDYQALQIDITARSSQATQNPVHGLPWGSGTWLLADTPEWQAWRAHARRSSPLDRYGGWIFPTRWPEGVESSDSRQATSLTRASG